MTVQIRAALADDYADFTRLFAELAIPDPLPPPDRFAATIVPVMSVAIQGDQVVGYVTWRQYGELAHVMQVAVDRHVRGQRIGEQLLVHARTAARSAGCKRWYLNVKRDNTSAIALYTRCGLTLELESTLLKVEWAHAPRVEGVVETLATAEEDPEIAARFNVPLERIQTFRSRPTFRMIVLRDEGALVGFAPFDIAFPGAPTLCAATPDLAAALVEAIRHHADPQIDFIRLCIEGDRALTDALVALGAEVMFEILRLSAPIA